MRRAPAGRLLLALMLAATFPAGAQTDPRQQLQDAERARAAQQDAEREAAARAAARAGDERRLVAARDAALLRLRGAEAATAAAADRVAALARQRRQAQARLDARAADLAPLLPLIERLSLFPAETLLAVPADPDTALRGVLVLGGIARQLEADAEALRAEQAALAQADRALQAETPRLTAAQAEQAARAAELDGRIADAQGDRRAAEADAAAAGQAAAEQGARADSLRAAIAAIEAERRAAETRAREAAARAERQKRAEDADRARQREAALARPTGPGTIAPSAEPGGQLTAPVAGSVVRSWGDAGEAGPAIGLSYRAAPGARVVAPCAGRVVFSGPFRSYGRLLILDCGGGYHAVLAGLDRLEAGVGRRVDAGEPVGAMGAWDPRAPEAERPTLYVELRRNGQAINPAPWLKGRS